MIAHETRQHGRVFSFLAAATAVLALAGCAKAPTSGGIELRRVDFKLYQACGYDRFGDLFSPIADGYENPKTSWRTRDIVREALERICQAAGAAAQRAVNAVEWGEAGAEMHDRAADGEVDFVNRTEEGTTTATFAGSTFNMAGLRSVTTVRTSGQRLIARPVYATDRQGNAMTSWEFTASGPAPIGTSRFPAPPGSNEGLEQLRQVSLPLLTGNLGLMK